jgi:hypothetical protein
MSAATYFKIWTRVGGEPETVPPAQSAALMTTDIETNFGEGR